MKMADVLTRGGAFGRGLIVSTEKSLAYLCMSDRPATGSLGRCAITSVTLYPTWAYRL